MTRHEKWVRALSNDPRVARTLRDPRVQRWLLRALRLRGRAEGAVDRRLQRVARALNLATQRDLRALQRRIRDLERELRSAEERFIEAADAREAPDRIGTRSTARQPGERRR